MTNLIPVIKKILTRIIVYPIGLFLIGSGGFIDYMSVILLIQGGLTIPGYVLMCGFFCFGTAMIGCGISLFFIPGSE